MAYTTIDNPELYFQAKIWTGNGSATALTLDGEEDMQPDWVMIKQRSSTQQWNGYDDVRGVQKYLGFNTNILENTQSQGLTAFGSNGFTVGTDDMVNKSSSTYVAYCWKESATAGFDMVLYTGNGSNRTISHSLSATPDLVIIKKRNNTGDWMVGGSTMLGGDNKLLLLNTTAALDTNSEVYQSFSSSTFGIGVNAYTNADSDTYIAYCFAGKQGYSKFGSYTGNGETSGAFIHLGFKPAWFLCKNVQDAGDNWILHDNKRDTFNVTENGLAPNDNGSEFTDVDMDFVSNGVKMRNNTGRANSAKSFIYMAFAESPFVNSNGVPTTAK